MASALAGTVAFNTQLNAGAGNLRGVCADSSGTNAYCANNAGKIYKVDIGSGVAAGGSWPLTGLTTPNQVVISPDDSTLYVLQDNGDVYTVPTGSPSATLLGTFNNINSLTSAWRHLVLDPLDPTKLLASSQSGKKIYVMNAADGSVTYPYFFPVGKGTNSPFVNGLGFAPGEPDLLFITLPSVANLSLSGAQLLRYRRRRGTVETVLGNGSATNSTGPNASCGFALVNNVNNCGAGDPDGRVYLGRSAAVLTMIDPDGVVTNINASLPQNIDGAICYVRPVNRLLLCATGSRLHIIS